ncbi:MAG TPA: hypothetical protein DEA08_07920, partial [Planctomycetes bacterium]|nr:hypothetical protein [Planctomycetota bacterium]
RLGRRVPQRVRGLAQRLAERFARARWAPGEVSAAEVEAARVEVAEIEAAWPDEAEGSGA